MTIGMPRIDLAPAVVENFDWVHNWFWLCFDNLFVRHRRTGRAREMDNIKMFETGFAAPPAEISAGIIKRVAKFDEHV
jgi:hypothetical protein